MARRDLTDGVVRRSLGAASADHQDGRRAVAGPDDHVRDTRRRVEEVPLPERHLLVLDDREAFAAEHQEELLGGLVVVERRRLARLEHADVDADVAVALEGARLAEHVALAGVGVLVALDLSQVRLEPALLGHRGEPYPGGAPVSRRATLADYFGGSVLT